MALKNLAELIGLLNDLIERHFTLLRRAVRWTCKGAMVMNLGIVPLGLLLGLAVPEAWVVIYLGFYYLIWLWLPAVGILVVLLFHERRKQPVGRPGLDLEKRRSVRIPQLSGRMPGALDLRLVQLGGIRSAPSVSSSCTTNSSWLG